MSSHSSDSESDAEERARLAFALWQPPPASSSLPQTQAKPVAPKKSIIGFQQPDFREIPKPPDTILLGDDDFVQNELPAWDYPSVKVSREDYYGKYKDSHVNGIYMSEKERWEHSVAQTKGSKLLDQAISGQIDFVIFSSKNVEDTHGMDENDYGIRLLSGSVSKIVKFSEERNGAGGFAAHGRIGQLLVKKARSRMDDSDSFSSSENLDESDNEGNKTASKRKARLEQSGVIVDFSSSSQTFKPLVYDNTKSSKPIQREIMTSAETSTMEIDQKMEKFPGTSNGDDEQSHKKDKKEKKKKHKKDKKEKEKSKHKKKRKRDQMTQSEEEQEKSDS